MFHSIFSTTHGNKLLNFFLVYVCTHYYHCGMKVNTNISLTVDAKAKVAKLIKKRIYLNLSAAVEDMIQTAAAKNKIK